MTRKDYELIAAPFARVIARRDNDTRSLPTIELLSMIRGAAAVAEDLADDLEADNPNFDRARFLRACGLEA
jgi:hypothetical protein